MHPFFSVKSQRLQFIHFVFTKKNQVKLVMQFGSWKTRGKVVMVNDDDFACMTESIEEEFTAFLTRQTTVEAWQVNQVNQAKQLPSWMKTTSLNRCNRTPPLPPKARLGPPPPTPPPRGRKSRGFLGSSDLPPSTSSCSASDLSSAPPPPPSPFHPRVK